MDQQKQESFTKEQDQRPSLQFQAESSTDDSDKSGDYNKIEVPDGGYGWFIVLAVFLYNFCTWGANSGYAVYLAHYLQYNSFPPGNKLDYAAIGGFAFGCGLLFSPIITWFTYMTSVRLVIGIGILLQCAALLLAAFSKKLWQIYLTQGVLISFGLAFVSIPSITLLPQWFRKKRSLAQGLGAAGSGLGGIIFNLAMQRMIEIRNVKWALIVQCIICTVLSSVALTLTRTRQSAIRKDSQGTFKLFDWQVCRSLGTWLTIFWVCFTMFGYVVLLYSLSAFTVSLGYSSKQGSIVSCMVSVGALFGRPVVGYLSDIFGPITVSIVVHMVVAIFSWAMWIPCRNFATALVFALIQGSLMGSIWPLSGTIVTRVVGLPKLNVTFSLVWMFLAAFGIISPIIGLELRTSNSKSGNNFVHTAIFVGFGYFGAALCLWLLRGYIIARDELAAEAKTGFDDGELHLTVNQRDLIKGLFRTGKLHRKV